MEEGRRTIVWTRTMKVSLTSPAMAEEGRGFLHLPDAEYVNLKTALTSPLKKRVSLKGKIVQEDVEVVKAIRGVDTARKTIF
ncbi:uncharacterized protein LOC123540775 [Mercenaria mercenaria]|uniref:uncharacterized protein LOC123540775 n=1 Tax=Mercenaria mercenaria TaxID=6596 RepID=UPI00234EE9B0|nr:uncharacterized protein LOC123540775 [Mercenaria mercenaria]